MTLSRFYAREMNGVSCVMVDLHFTFHMELHYCFYVYNEIVKYENTSLECAKFLDVSGI